MTENILSERQKYMTIDLLENSKNLKEIISRTELSYYIIKKIADENSINLVHMTELPDSEIEKIVKTLKEHGGNATKVASIVGCSIQTVRKYGKKNSVKMRKRGDPPIIPPTSTETKLKIIEYYKTDSNISFTELGKLFGCSRLNTAKIIEEFGYERKHKVTGEKIKKMLFGYYLLNKNGRHIADILNMDKKTVYSFFNNLNLKSNQTITRRDPKIKEINIDNSIGFEMKYGNLYFVSISENQLYLMKRFNFLKRDLYENLDEPIPFFKIKESLKNSGMKDSYVDLIVSSKQNIIFMSNIFNGNFYQSNLNHFIKSFYSNKSFKKIVLNP